MATMVYRGLQPCVDSQFLVNSHLNFNAAASQLPPSFQFAFSSCFPDHHHQDSSSKSVNQCDDADLNQILLNYNVSLPDRRSSDAAPVKSDLAAPQEVAKSVMAIKKFDEPAAYVHPLVKRSRSALSENSLALCTENLGNETGAADFVDESVFSDLEIERSTIRKRVKSEVNRGNNKKQFPPPLTTISGGDSIRVRSHREDGRLIMEVVKAPTRLSYFHVERSHGRLRLSILKTCTPKFDSVKKCTEKEKDEQQEEEEEVERIRSDVVGAVGQNGNCEENVGGKVEENGNFGGAEIEIENFQRPCRCNEAGGNNNINENKNNMEMLLLTREPFSIWVEIETS